MSAIRLTPDQKTVLLRLANAAEKKRSVLFSVRIDPSTGRQIRDGATAAALVRKGLARKLQDGRFEATDEGYWMGDELRVWARSKTIAGVGFPGLTRSEVRSLSKKLRGKNRRLPKTGYCQRLDDGREVCHDRNGYYYVGTKKRSG